ncbi:MAG: peptidase M48, Ste24p [Robiginitomaculum sp.]|nr:MAG: peptidase M48, Ste24p [Robiginitomaculum sp.]
MRLFGVLFALLITSVLSTSSSWAQGIIRDAEIESVIREWSDPIFKAAGLNASDVNIHVINDGSMNAFVTRGQNMFLHTGIILNAETPNELIGVIAHETGHMAGGHLARSDDALKKAARPMLLTMGLGILAAVAGAPDAAAVIMSSAQKNGTVTFFAYTRVLEASTDQAAENYMEATGQSGRGLLRFFQRFRYNEVFSGATRYPYFLSHPLSSERISALETRVEASPFKDVKDSAEDIAKLNMMKAKIIGFLNPPETTFSLYPETDTTKPARYARAVANYQIASTKTALKQMRALLEEEPENPYFNEFYGQILFESGQAQKALRYHSRAVELRPDSPLLRLNLAQALIATDTPENISLAVGELKKVLAREHDNGFAWYQLSVAYERQGKITLAKLATAEQAYAMGDYLRARSFAQRALIELPQGTPEWRRANDITLVIAADPRIRKQAAQRRRH